MNNLIITSDINRHNELIEIYTEDFKDHSYFFENKLEFRDSLIDFKNLKKLKLIYKEIEYLVEISSNIIHLDDVLSKKNN